MAVIITNPTSDELRAIRGYILRFLDSSSPVWLTEITLRRRLYAVQHLPSQEVLLREINYLRDKGYLKSDERPDGPVRPGEPPASTTWYHTITARGHELLTGDISDMDEHVQVM